MQSLEGIVSACAVSGLMGMPFGYTELVEEVRRERGELWLFGLMSLLEKMAMIDVWYVWVRLKERNCVSFNGHQQRLNSASWFQVEPHR